MALFDRLIADDGTYKIVDLGHPSFKSFFKVANDIGFAEEARRRDTAPVVLFLISPDEGSVDAYAALRRDFPYAAVVPVYNEGLGGSQHRDKFSASLDRARCCCSFLRSRPDCASTSSGGPSRSLISGHPRPKWPLRIISSCRNGYGACSWSSARWNSPGSDERSPEFSANSAIISAMR